MLEGRIIRGVSGVYDVETADGIINCKARGKLKRDGEICVGDIVTVQNFRGGKGVIETVRPRKNRLVRPYVSNVDTLIAVLAPIPEPDMLLADKLLASCVQQGIEPIVCVNKSDMASAAFIEKTRRDYDGIAPVLAVSALTGRGLDTLKSRLSGLVCLAGQSATGKSSIINALLGASLETGALSEKSGRGKHTTRQVEILKGDGFYIADTCGFSCLEMPLLEPREIAALFVDFEKFSPRCKFRGCSHVDEPECAVREAVLNGGLPASRYERYKTLYKQAKENWRKRYE